MLDVERRETLESCTYDGVNLCDGDCLSCEYFEAVGDDPDLEAT